MNDCFVPSTNANPTVSLARRSTTNKPLDVELGTISQRHRFAVDLFAAQVVGGGDQTVVKEEAFRLKPIKNPWEAFHSVVKIADHGEPGSTGQTGLLHPAISRQGKIVHLDQAFAVDIRHLVPNPGVPDQ